LPTTPERNKAEDLFRAIEQFQGRGYAQLKGVILNARGVPDESALVQAAAEEMGTQVIIEIPRDIAVQFCEEKNMTVVQGSPDSSLAQVITGWLR
jgi:nitrogenase iron protein NifH